MLLSFDYFYYKISFKNDTFLFGCLLLFWKNDRMLFETKSEDQICWLSGNVIFGYKIGYDYMIMCHS